MTNEDNDAYAIAESRRRGPRLGDPLVPYDQVSERAALRRAQWPRCQWEGCTHSAKTSGKLPDGALADLCIFHYLHDGGEKTENR